VAASFNGVAGVGVVVSLRTDAEGARPRTQPSVAISRDGRHWFLLNASPDVREQLIAIET
jgi:phosphoribosyl 1,2-cyclic phosphodiesterase